MAFWKGFSRCVFQLLQQWIFHHLQDKYGSSLFLIINNSVSSTKSMFVFSYCRISPVTFFIVWNPKWTLNPVVFFFPGCFKSAAVNLSLCSPLLSVHPSTSAVRAGLVSTRLVSKWRRLRAVRRLSGSAVAGYPSPCASSLPRLGSSFIKTWDLTKTLLIHLRVQIVFFSSSSFVTSFLSSPPPDQAIVCESIVPGAKGFSKLFFRRLVSRDFVFSLHVLFCFTFSNRKL